MLWTYTFEESSTEKKVTLSYQFLCQENPSVDPHPPTADQVRNDGLYFVLGVWFDDCVVHAYTAYPAGSDGTRAVLLPVSRAGEGIAFVNLYLYSCEGLLLMEANNIFIPPTVSLTSAIT